ncbi:hypothetical protein PYH37_000157 [Sinorhizobium numidicum]|uniref:Uncharacterized protein n=1 Tax=Sinorhizobium numidicum TaxID=680248 RepID=A0ABY8CQC8_9HYPH|nr:hypothetical protein [Sinorhizobium numidicum]WEX74860.1 hypothetical protein PYH37_000157 [Sinorhizobium numidicum]WEX80853.1 hypothetical protein PYH38_000159 [Sinorhizobium numidicum]
MPDAGARHGPSTPLNVIIPLAGRDFERPDGSVKAEMVVGGTTLLRATLEARPWWSATAAPVFVLRDTAASQRFARETLCAEYPAARIVWLSHASGGAAWSAVAGATLIARQEAPIIVDLCDIIFESDADVAAAFTADPALGGLALTFASRHPQYSYLRLAPDGRMQEAKEKVVISGNASAGVYAFRDVAVFHAAFAHSLHHRATLSHQGALFVCPMLNGVVAQGLDVRCLPAHRVLDVKLEGASLAD